MEEIPRPTYKRLLIWSPGGGTIKRANTDAERKIQIFGTSSRYGKADHQRTELIVKKDYFGHIVEISEAEVLDGAEAPKEGLELNRPKPIVPLPKKESN